MESLSGMQIEAGFSDLLATLLDDVVPTSSLQALPWSQQENVSQSAPETVVPFGSPKDRSHPKRTHATLPGVEVKGPKRRSSGNRGVQQHMHALQQHLDKQQRELQLQRMRKLFLTERVTILELLIQVREAQEARLNKIRLGLDYNPFAAVGVGVKEFASFTPGAVSQKLGFLLNCLTTRLASIMPLIQKYPQLATHRPSAKFLNEIAQELSLAEPTNPYGADGLPVGSLTIPVPPEILAKVAAAYSLDLSSMSDDDHRMLESCALLLVEKMCTIKFGEHVYFIMPQLLMSMAVHVDTCAVSSTWEDLASNFSCMQLKEEATGKLKTGATVATEGHWEKVARNVCLTDKQKLQAAVLWEIISGAKSTILSERAQIAQQLSHLISPAEANGTPPPSASDTQSVAGSMPGHQSGQQQQQQQTMQKGLGSRRTLQQERLLERHAAARCWLSPEQLTQQEMLMHRLHGTLIKERLLIILVRDTLYTHILSPIQIIQATVYSHPYALSHLAVLSQYAAQCNMEVMERLLASEGKDHN